MRWPFYQPPNAGIHEIARFFAIRTLIAGLVCLWVAPARSDDLAHDLHVSRGQVTFEAEGAGSKPYVPDDNSGLTIGRGYDLKDRTCEEVVSDLQRAGLDSVQAMKYAEAAHLNAADARKFIADHQEASLAKAAEALGLKGDEAAHYVQVNRLAELSPKQQKELFELAYEQYRDSAKAEFPDFDDYPLGAQDGLVDMAYSLGMKGLLTKFPKFVDAIRKQDWDSAAKESERGGVGEQRDVMVKKLLHQAALFKQPAGADDPLAIYCVSSYTDDAPTVGMLAGAYKRRDQAMAAAQKILSNLHVVKVEVDGDNGMLTIGNDSTKNKRVTLKFAEGDFEPESAKKQHDGDTKLWKALGYQVTVQQKNGKPNP
jgi:GH24 family phage-related lysozyme (muramidase)